MVASIDIGGRLVGAGASCFVIAEAGVNHNGSVESACLLVDAAGEAGADAVKFQTFRADALVTPNAPKAAYQLAANSSESQLDMLRALELPRDAYPVILDRCRSRGILFLSTPFDVESADFLDALGMPAFKISSGEITNFPFLAHVARKCKPIILSTGMASLYEVESAVKVIEREGHWQVVLLHCVSNYPAAPAEVNLRAMRTMSEAFGLPIGYSDHTLGSEVAIAAVALGACVLEKHFTMSRAWRGPDHQASLQPDELADLVRAVRIVESSLGDGNKTPAASEAAVAAAIRRSLVAAANIPAGTVLTEEVIAIKRPGIGLPPAMRGQIVGRTARVMIPEGAVIDLEMLA